MTNGIEGIGDTFYSIYLLQRNKKNNICKDDIIVKCFFMVKQNVAKRKYAEVGIVLNVEQQRHCKSITR